MPSLRLSGENLSVRRGGRPVFEGLSFRLTAGDVGALTGPNGAGKSTLLRLIAGLLKPISGAVRLDPEPEEGIGPALHYLGHLDAVKPAFTVSENLAFWRRVFGGAGDIEAALEVVGLPHLAAFPVSTLSAGQRRRVALARLLIVDRPVWLLDEPATALDASAEAMLGDLIAGHLAEGGIVLAATHRPLPVTPAVTIDLGPVR